MSYRPSFVFYFLSRFYCVVSSLFCTLSFLLYRPFSHLSFFLSFLILFLGICWWAELWSEWTKSLQEMFSELAEFLIWFWKLQHCPILVHVNQRAKCVGFFFLKKKPIFLFVVFLFWRHSFFDDAEFCATDCSRRCRTEKSVKQKKIFFFGFLSFCLSKDTNYRSWFVDWNFSIKRIRVLRFGESVSKYLSMF